MALTCDKPHGDMNKEDVNNFLETLYRQTWGWVVSLGQQLGKQPKFCPHCGKDPKTLPD